MKVFYPAVFLEEQDGYSVRFPDLEGCFTEGDTLEQAYSNAFEAMGLFFDDKGEKFAFPKASRPADIELAEGETVVLVEFDIDEYRKRFDSRKIKKTLTLSAWVNAAAEEKKINFFTKEELIYFRKLLKNNLFYNIFFFS